MGRWEREALSFYKLKADVLALFYIFYDAYIPGVKTTFWIITLTTLKVTGICMPHTYTHWQDHANYVLHNDGVVHIIGFILGREHVASTHSSLGSSGARMDFYDAVQKHFYGEFSLTAALDVEVTFSLDHASLVDQWIVSPFTVA